MTDREKFIAMFRFFAAHGFMALLTYRMDRTARLSLANDQGEREVIFEDCSDATPDLCGEIFAEMVADLARAPCSFESSVLYV
jgi:hypothetical protein